MVSAKVAKFNDGKRAILVATNCDSYSHVTSQVIGDSVLEASNKSRIFLLTFKPESERVGATAEDSSSQSVPSHFSSPLRGGKDEREGAN